MCHLNFVDSLQLKAHHTLSMLYVRTGVLGQESFHRLLILGVMDDRAVVFHHRGSLAANQPKLAFLVGSHMGGDIIRANWLEAGYSFRLQLVDQEVTSSRVIPRGICVLPEEAISERVMRPLMQAGLSLSTELNCLSEVDYPELMDMPRGFRESVRGVLAGLPADQRRNTARMLAQVYQTEGESSFLGALSGFGGLSRLYGYVDSA